MQQIADSADAIKRARGRRGLEMLNRIQHNTKIEVRIHDGDFPEEKGVDAKLVRLARNLNAKLFTNDYNLSKIAQLQKVSCVNLHEVANCLKVILLPGEIVQIKIVREGKDKGQGVGYLPDGTMVVVNNGQTHVGQQAEVQVQSCCKPARASSSSPKCEASPRARPTPHSSPSESHDVTIFTAFNPADAQLVRSRLEAAGFNPFVAGELAALSMEGYSLAVGGIRVQVPEPEAADAKEFLDAPAHARRMTSAKIKICAGSKKSCPAKSFLIRRPEKLFRRQMVRRASARRRRLALLRQIRFQDPAVCEPE